MAGDRLEQLRKKRDQLNARIQRESAREQQRQRKARDARLMRWGVALDRALEHGELSREQVAAILNRHLVRDSDRRRAFTGPLEGYDPQPSPDE